MQLYSHNLKIPNTSAANINPKIAYRPVFENIINGSMDHSSIPTKLSIALDNVIRSAKEKGVETEVYALLVCYASEIKNDIVLLMLKRLLNLIDSSPKENLPATILQCKQLMLRFDEAADTIPELVSNIADLTKGKTLSTSAMAKMISSCIGTSSSLCPKEVSGILIIAYEKGSFDYLDQIADIRLQKPPTTSDSQNRFVNTEIIKPDFSADTLSEAQIRVSYSSCVFLIDSKRSINKIPLAPLTNENYGGLKHSLGSNCVQLAVKTEVIPIPQTKAEAPGDTKNKSTAPVTTYIQVSSLPKFLKLSQQKLLPLKSKINIATQNLFEQTRILDLFKSALSFRLFSAANLRQKIKSSFFLSSFNRPIQNFNKKILNTLFKFKLFLAYLRSALINWICKILNPTKLLNLFSAQKKKFKLTGFIANSSRDLIKLLLKKFNFVRKFKPPLFKQLAGVQTRSKIFYTKLIPTIKQVIFFSKKQSIDKIKRSLLLILLNAFSSQKKKLNALRKTLVAFLKIPVLILFKNKE